MSVLSFQQALSSLITSPRLQESLKADAGSFFKTYELTPLEKKRLLDVVRQSGMRMNNILYRGNRITPIYTMFPYTSLLLGTGFLGLTDEYCAANDEPDLQFSKELQLWVSFLEEKIDRGMITNEYVREILHFEAALTELRFAAKKKITASLQSAAFCEHPDSWMVHPLIRVVIFNHPPAALFEQLTGYKKVINELPAGEYYLVVDGKSEEPEYRVIHPVIGQLLIAIKTNPSAVSVENAEILFNEHLLVCL